MTFNLKKLNKISQVSQIEVDPYQDLNFIAAASKVLEMHPEYDNIQEFISSPPLGMEEINNIEAIINYSQTLESEVVDDAVSGLRNTELAVDNLTNKMMSKKHFNLKEAQMPVPFGADDLNDSPELMGDQMGMQQDTGSLKKYETHSDLNNMLIGVANSPNVFQSVWNDILRENPQESDSAQAALKSYFQGFEMKGEEQRLEEAQVIHQLIYGKEDIMPIDAEYKEVGASANESSKIIKKIAQKITNKNKKSAFNLTKTAQHKTLDNAILWGPGETRIDPFLHQPVSDWHIVERNKGFGLVVDDIWNIDYETIWRENVMDKYSRPYKNKEGEWVGGYLNKRFEIDRNIPETSNMQLKPGQLRRPILPEYGNTESRLQAARAKGDIAGAIDTSKPFNWKEASKKKS